MRTKDKTVNKSLAWLGSGGGSNAAHVDVMDGEIVRIRPIHFDECYTPEELNAWRFEKDGHVFEAGDKTFLPPLSIAYKRRATSPNRVPYPLIRVDWDPYGQRNPQNRGTSKYRRISWDEATDVIASEIQRIHDAYGPRSIYCEGDGHGEGNCYAGGHGCMINLFHMADGCTLQARQPDSWEGWVWGAKHVWGMEPVGSSTSQVNAFHDITQNGDAILFWGCDPETAPWGWGGQQASRLCYWFSEIGIKSIYVCPDVNYGAAVHADKWIPVLPNTDSALQLAIAYTWIDEGTYEEEFLKTHAVGFDVFRDYVMGISDGVPKTPAWASPKCGVPVYKIKALARYWAKHAVSIAHCNGGSYIRSAFSHEPARLEVVLLAMQGLDKPGAHQATFTDMGVMGESCNPLPPSKVTANQRACYHGWSYNVGDSFIIKTLLPDAIMSDKVDWYSLGVFLAPRETQFQPFEYPRPGEAGIKMIWSDAPCWSTCWNCGHRDQDALRSENLEFVLVQHPWFENDCKFADIILPITTTFECDDFGTDNNNGQYSMFYYEKQAIEPVGEARTDYEAVLSVFRKLDKPGSVYEGVVEKYTQGMGYEGWMRRAWETSGVTQTDKYGSFEELFEADDKFWMGPTLENWEDRKSPLELFCEDPEMFPLLTPTGKLEIYSEALAEHFPDDDIRGPFPKWIEESDEHKERYTSDRAKLYPFLMVSNHPHWRVHAQHDDLPWLREIETCKVIGPDGYAYEPLWLHPSDAAKIGLKNGDVAKIFNERGAVLGGVRVTERIMPGVVYQDHGARVDSIVPGYGGLDRGGANNLICPSAVTSPNCAGEVTSSFLVGVEKVDVFELAKQYPEAFARTFDPATGQVASDFIVEGE